MKVSDAIFSPNCPCYLLFRPFLWYGWITGQCYIVCSNSKCLQKCFFIYCILVLLYLLFFFVRLFVAFDFSEAAFNTKTLLQGLMPAYILLTVGSQLCTITVQFRLKYLFECIYKSLSTNHLPDYTFLRRILYVFIGFCVFFSTANGVLVCLFSLDIVKLPVKPSVVNNDHRFLWVDALSMWFAQNSLTYCLSFYALLCYSVRQNLIALAESMGKSDFSPCIALPKNYGKSKIRPL